MISLGGSRCLQVIAGANKWWQVVACWVAMLKDIILNSRGEKSLRPEPKPRNADSEASDAATGPSPDLAHDMEPGNTSGQPKVDCWVDHATNGRSQAKAKDIKKCCTSDEDQSTWMSYSMHLSIYVDFWLYTYILRECKFIALHSSGFFRASWETLFVSLHLVRCKFFQPAIVVLER